jgi:hypothetical protein
VMMRLTRAHSSLGGIWSEANARTAACSVDRRSCLSPHERSDHWLRHGTQVRSRHRRDRDRDPQPEQVLR